MKPFVPEDEAAPAGEFLCIVWDQSVAHNSVCVCLYVRVHSGFVFARLCLEHRQQRAEPIVS